MGKQITFYMGRRDEAAFVEYLRSTGDVAIIPQTSRQELAEEFSNFSESEGRALGENVRLWNRAISPRPVIKYVQQQDYYWLDSLQSEVVDVWRSKMTQEGLSMGRLWIEPKTMDTDKGMQSKGVEFTAWFSALCRWIKGQAVRVVDGAHVLPEADEMTRTGVQLIGHAP